MKKEISYLIDEFISLSDELRPGYSLSIAKDKESSLILPESLNILYSKVSGTYYEIEDQRLMDFLPGYLLIRDAEYESFTQSVKEMIPNGEDKYYPILVNYSSDFYALKVSEGKENGIFLIEHDADGPTKIHHSFEDFLRTIIACYKEKIYFLDDDGYLDMDFDEEQLIGQKYNPDIDYWFED
ncbi:SMI1/KNR4 family protein [Muribaculaceae bacterium Isolate-039 (Harlan)]|jgi:hypothetical protein|uniref:SMI1/KNR4 family protein n=3 Tax=Muribaculaceae TaxID=2005473 RepID=A0A4S2FKS0_9BACT|nr:MULTISPECIES: SMI1/KNR4 family protein [Muribaculaceae]ROS86642.1 SMI1/KNR4 family protein [Muribaculaceae bacterium Isolate-039 (Harlan)]ROS95522.1 SMI1/KNR4 family protein [Muribaculaceae bacterium Isolate-083 (Janvier)]ROS96043.1 SMI1/KNR4 family protein [Muribaculaceae bacterium Isolate-077 (Janvier)]ROS99539.1 SMI1/KNR4 family protein [Muribaculaceae bacterium Isolate-084 (Janvier)]MYM13614.1 hypothetical protein [Muribaculum intestinale]